VSTRFFERDNSFYLVNTLSQAVKKKKPKKATILLFEKLLTKERIGYSIAKTRQIENANSSLVKSLQQYYIFFCFAIK